MQFVVLATGNLSKGFSLHGPFSTKEEANDYSCNELTEYDTYTIPLSEPVSDEELKKQIA